MSTARLLKKFAIVMVVVILSACGGSGGGGSSGGADGGTPGGGAGGSSGGAVTTSGGTASGGESNVTVAQGQFIDSAVSGLNFSSGGQSGLTDVEGKFTYEVGQPVTFSIGGIVIGTAIGKSTITPVDLVSGADDHTNPTVINIASFLQSLNAGGDPNNGIAITDKTRSLATGKSVDFNQNTTQFSQDKSVQAIVSELTGANPAGARQLVDVTTAQNHLAASLSALSGGIRKGDQIMAKLDAGPCEILSPAYSCINVVGVPAGGKDSQLFQQIGGVHGIVSNTCATAVPQPTTCATTPNWYQVLWDAEPANQHGPQGWSQGWSSLSNISLVPPDGVTQKPDLASSYYQSDNPYWNASKNQDPDPVLAPGTPKWPLGSTDPNGAYGNCVWYAWGRMLELGRGSQQRQNQLKAIANSQNAFQWIGNAKNAERNNAPLGVTIHDVTIEPAYKPQVGDIAAFDAVPNKFSDGHVAVVESVNAAEGTYTVSESAYSTSPSLPWNVLWRGRTIKQTATPPIGFQYFIHVEQSEKINQTISAIGFSPNTLTVGGTATASATASSGLQVTFSATTSDVCSVTALGKVTGNSAGVCTIAANQVGNAGYNVAPQVTGNIAIAGNSNDATPSTPTNLNFGSSSGPGQTSGDITVTLSWNPSPGATRYEVTVRDAATGMIVEDSTIGSTSFSPSHLSAGRQYTWNVDACNPAGCSAFASRQSFQTAGKTSTTPSVSSVSPSSMTANGTSQSLVISGSGFVSGNMVQFKWGQGTGANIWTNASGTVTVNSSSQITVGMNPGTVTDTISVRVCSSSGSSNCSSGTQSVAVTAPVATPSVSSVSPSSMTANGTSQSLVISGSGFVSGNMVQFKWGQGTGANIWTNASGTVTVNSSSQITVGMNPGTVTDTISVRVCSSSGSSNCSSGAQSVAVTAPVATPGVSSVSPSSMTANGTSQSLVINGSGFVSGNMVQFKWGQGTGANVWTNASGTVTVNSSSQITVGMNPGTVTDTISVRVCSSSGSSNCSSGAQSVAVTAPVATPGVSSVSPSSMTANGTSQSLVINGSGFVSGNMVQFKWGQGTGANVWTNASGTVTVNSSSQITVGMNPGTVTDTISVRVCSSGSSNCSSGAQTVSVIR